MLRRHMPVPFDLTCAVDQERGLPASVRTIDIGCWPPPRKGMRPTTYKLSLFDPCRVPFEEFLYLDTSMVIRRDMTELLEFAFGQPHDLVAVKDWNYDAYNTSVMRIRQTADLREIPRAYEAGVEFNQRVPGDQDFVTGVIRQRGWEEKVTTFPEEMVACFGAARRLSKTNRREGYQTLESATIVKFNGHPKMDEVIDPRCRLRQVLKTGNPFHRRAWFWVKEAKQLWR
ncbi:hypothetical protein EON82_02700 [bacterium]|nr:MAG: hypothetical protein EON82_02700 [bacterium]